MERIDKQAILDRTHYGTGIYAYILRLYYPDEIVMKITGRDCGFCRNPFFNGEPTLHIWIEKTNTQEPLSPEIARHEDRSNTIPAGDAFSFAGLHYKKSGDELLETLNKEMSLHIGEERNFYNRYRVKPQHITQPVKTPQVLFSFFKAPVSNIKPYKSISLLDAYHYIVENCARQRTLQLRSLADVRQARIYKAANFDYCTFSGVFSSRSDKALEEHSNLLCIDFDHLPHVEDLFQRLLKDEYFDTQLLFRSPSGTGLKWIIPIDITQAAHSHYFAAIANYIRQTYGITVDKSGRDISRACFLPYDPRAFINPSYLK